MNVTPPPLPPPGEPAAPSLWHELSDGTAGWGVRLVSNVALAAAMGGLVPLLAYFLAALIPDWNRAAGSGSVYPTDELIGFLAAMAAGGFLAATAWIWSRIGARRAILAPVVLTIAIAVTTITLGVIADENLRGDAELVIMGMIALAGAAVIVIWLQAFRRGPRWRAIKNRQDGLPDVRCPACDYRMVGLTESRCPECGAAYTLDELIAKQGFGPASPRLPEGQELDTRAALRSA